MQIRTRHYWFSEPRSDPTKGGSVPRVKAKKQDERLQTNLEPHGAYDWASAWFAQEDKNVNAMIAKGDKSRSWEIYKQHLDLLGKQPNIPLTQLKKYPPPRS